ncbi:MAG: glycosyltransferase [Gemmatimonadaceae bacterium]
MEAESRDRVGAEPIEHDQHHSLHRGRTDVSGHWSTSGEGSVRFSHSNDAPRCDGSRTVGSRTRHDCARCATSATVTGSSRIRHAQPRNISPHARRLLHRHLPAPGQRRVGRHRYFGRGSAGAGGDVHVIAPKYPDGGADRADPDMTAVPSVSLPLYPDVRLVAPDYFAVRRAIDRFRPDLVHCATEFLVGRLGQMAASRAKLPVVTSYHTDFSRYMTSYGVPWLAKPVSRYLARFHKRALRTFTPSHASRDDLRLLGVSDVVTWGCGVDAERFHPSRRSQELRVKLGIDGAFTFLYVGRLAAEKGVDIVIEAYRRAAARLPRGSTRLVIAGADAFAFASTTETLGLVVLEAMASGLSVIAAPAGGVAEHLRDGENGLAYSANDIDACAEAMVRLASDGALSTRLRAGARRTADALSWQSELDRLDESYRSLCADACAPANGRQG